MTAARGGVAATEGGLRAGYVPERDTWPTTGDGDCCSGEVAAGGWWLPSGQVESGGRPHTPRGCEVADLLTAAALLARGHRARLKVPQNRRVGRPRGRRDGGAGRGARPHRPCQPGPIQAAAALAACRANGDGVMDALPDAP